jgi:hypothetical protein
MPVYTPTPHHRQDPLPHWFRYSDADGSCWPAARGDTTLVFDPAGPVTREDHTNGTVTFWKPVPEGYYLEGRHVLRLRPCDSYDVLCESCDAWRPREDFTSLGEELWCSHCSHPAQFDSRNDLITRGAGMDEGDLDEGDLDEIDTGYNDVSPWAIYDEHEDNYDDAMDEATRAWPVGPRNRDGGSLMEVLRPPSYDDRSFRMRLAHWARGGCK